ncbi:Dynamin family protein [Kandleria vitulina]|uniref:LeoA/HP0731 family dynamin-like GTPase n=1 Tax=Kandleria vitulina TaxID=1630 RepID=UPI0008C3FA73|nr:LeoA/HP0731 family dynamin-like GTPase [Kandleria vitulina]SEJ10775.1 Dynamin family protein [Kandleria vitulina]
MYDFKNYIDDKTVLIQKMDIAEKKIQELDGMGIDISESIKKIESAKRIVQENKISIVLVGAFSDGKTSVAAGWINEKLDNMKIASDESSDEILCYTPTTIPEGCQIVDTPGLFGDKVGADENGGQILLSDITKKFISEANLILYVVAAKNPIKDSHKECIRWILKDLNKLSSTIFVINRMDDVADLTDEEDYSLQASIKTENLRKRLLECGLNQSEANKVRVACISAAPNGLGIEFWNEHREEYLRRSHLDALENLANSILQSSRESLIAKTGCDILNDELVKTIELISEQERQIAEFFLPEKRNSLKRNKKDLKALYKRLVRSKKDMKNELKALNKKKVNAIRATSMDNFNDVLENEIGILPGKEGYVLNEEINDIFTEYAEKNYNWTMELGEKFQSGYNKQNKAMEILLKNGAYSASNGLKTASKCGVEMFKKRIFSGRDLLGKLGITIKFKPWQATKIATFAKEELPVIGSGIEVVTSITENIVEHSRNRKFEKSKDNMKNVINDTFNEVMQMLNSDDVYFDQFAQSYRILENQIHQDEEDIKYLESMLEKFNVWYEETMDVDYRII